MFSESKVCALLDVLATESMLPLIDTMRLAMVVFPKYITDTNTYS